MPVIFKRGLLLLCVCWCGLAAAADTLSKIRETQTFTIAYMATPPFSYLNEQEHVVGYSIDLCLRLADAIKKELKLPKLGVQYMPVDSLTRFSKLIDGQADIECGSTTANAERRTRVAFTVPHFFSSVRMVVKKDKGIRNWSDLRSKTIAVLMGSTTINLVNERSNVRSLNIKVAEAHDVAEAFAWVEQGRADAFAIDDVLLYSLRATAKNPADFAIVGEPLSVEQYSLMFRKDDPAFKKLVDQVLADLIRSGDFEKIYNYWFTQATGPKGSNMNMPMGFLLRDAMRFPSDKTAD
jgi:ABC-type amino acid transport substrate-binding protein